VGLGAGFQILICLYAVLFFYSIGLLTTGMRWYTLWQSICLFLLGGAGNGYLTSRAMRYFGSEDWSFSAGAASFVLPCYASIIFMIVDVLDWMERSKSMVPLATFTLWAFLWLIFNVPGAYWASQQAYMYSNDKPPCKVSIVKKPIPSLPPYLGFNVQCFGASFLIFTTVIFELHYVVTSIWRSYIVGMFFALFINVNITVLMTAMVSILFTYLNLKNGNHEWWWRSFFVGFYLTIWVFCYMLWMGALEFSLSGMAGDLVYCLYAFVFSQFLGFACGTVSVMASWVFVHFLYKASKSD